MSEQAHAHGGANSWTIDEWFVVALARTIRNGEAVFHGFASPCAQVAMHVAKRTHARDMLLIEGATYAVNPEPAFIPPTSNDLALHRGAAYRMRFEEFFDAATRGAIDRMFLSGGQIDAWGSTNVTAIGGMAGPGAGAQVAEAQTAGARIKLGGGCNISATVKRLTLWSTRHRSGRTLVPKLDFCTDIGHRTAAGTRAELGYRGLGPQMLVTELGIFGYDADGHAELRAVFPDVTVEQVERATGFELRVALAHGALQPPGLAELAAVRTVDPLGVRRSEFAPAELERRFVHDHAGGCAC